MNFNGKAQKILGFFLCYKTFLRRTFFYLNCYKE